jgi:hypothetical protein
LPTERGLRVIGAGYGRTGTASLKRALERLGFGPCHHMEELFTHPEQVPVWEAAGRGERVDWPVFLRGWGSAVDFPAALYWRELMEAFPDAKVVLTVRDPQSWYDSFESTILPLNRRFPVRQMAPWLPRVNAPFRVSNHPVMRRLVEIDRAGAVEMFREHVEEVGRVVPPERLLVFEVKQGWEPLCQFLGVPVPAEPFPRVNDTAEFQRRVTFITLFCWALLLFPVLLLGVILLAIWGL